MNNTKIKAVELNHFDGIANRVSFNEIKESLFNCEKINLIPSKIIVKLNISWGE